MLLRLAVLAGVQEAVRLRIRVGDDVNATDANGRTPLMLAAAKGHIKICALLLESGADPLVTDATGETVLATADRRGYTELVALLRDQLAASSEPVTDGAAHVAVAPKSADDSPRVFGARHSFDNEAAPASMIDIPAVPDEAIPQPPLTNHVLSKGSGILPMPTIAEVDHASVMLPALAIDMKAAVSLDSARLVSPAAGDRVDRILGDDDASELSGWEPEEDLPLPEHDTECAAVAGVLRRKIATHAPVDTAADWTDIEISLPDSEPRRLRSVLSDDRLDAVRHLLIQGLRDGFVTRWRIDALAVDVFGEPDDEFALQLKSTLTESGILIDEDDPGLQPASRPEDVGEDEEDAVMDAFAFMQNLASRHNDPASLYGLDLSRSGDLLTREQEVEIGQTIERAMDAAIMVIARSLFAIDEILQTAEQVRNELSVGSCQVSVVSERRSVRPSRQPLHRQLTTAT